MPKETTNRKGKIPSGGRTCMCTTDNELIPRIYKECLHQ